jgi:hypothetical protein
MAFTVFSFSSSNPLFSPTSIFRRLFFYNGTIFAFTWSGGKAAREAWSRERQALIAYKAQNRNISLVQMIYITTPPKQKLVFEPCM